MPLVHFLAAASHCMPAFLQAASVFGAPANAGAVKATTRLKARIDSKVFIDLSSDIRNAGSQPTQTRHHVGGVMLPSVRDWGDLLPHLARRKPRLGFCNRAPCDGPDARVVRPSLLLRFRRVQSHPSKGGSGQARSPFFSCQFSVVEILYESHLSLLGAPIPLRSGFLVQLRGSSPFL
jgi:hypothetical protein